jgi:hypothetical protein
MENLIDLSGLEDSTRGTSTDLHSDLALCLAVRVKEQYEMFASA